MLTEVLHVIICFNDLVHLLWRLSNTNIGCSLILDCINKKIQYLVVEYFGYGVNSNGFYSFSPFFFLFSFNFPWLDYSQAFTDSRQQRLSTTAWRKSALKLLFLSLKLHISP
jgi:hypothetical protein